MVIPGSQYPTYHSRHKSGISCKPESTNKLVIAVVVVADYLSLVTSKPCVIEGPPLRARFTWLIVSYLVAPQINGSYNNFRLFVF